MRHRSPNLILLLIAAIAVAGCAQATAFSRTESIRQRPAGVRVLLMRPDIELSELTVGGLREPKADWTAAAEEHVVAALRAELQGKKATLVPYLPPTQNPAREYAHTQLVKLHDIVGGAILIHKYLPALALPTKKDTFDWSLGQGVNVLRDDYGAEYCLFVLFRDSYASAGRKAMMVGAALFGVAIPGGTQVGFASLVDLQSGDILWFNRLINPAGDLRTPEAARKAVQDLLAEVPL